MRAVLARGVFIGFATGSRRLYDPRMRFRFALVSLAVVAAVLMIFLMRSEERETGPVEMPTVPVEEEMRAAIRVPVEPGTPAPEPVAEETRLAPKLELARGKLPWEQQIESVTGARDLNDAAKARRLLAMIAALPEDAFTAASEEAVKRLPDADYDSVALPVVANPQTHGLVESVLFADLMERPDAITLPALLRIARIPNHPYAKFAHDNLDLLIGEDFGTDWLKWEAAVRKTLAAEKATR